jgi:Fe-S cluster assembly protein SufD
MTTIVQDRYAEAKAHFQKLFDLQERRLNGHKSHPIHNIRTAAFERVSQLPFPTRRDEEWKYTSVNPILQLELQEGQEVKVDADTINAFLIPELDAHLMIFVNGIFQPQLSAELDKLPGGLTVMDLGTALQQDAYQEVIQRQLQEIIVDSDDAFRNLNAAFIRNGFFIHVAAGTVVDKPLYFLHLAAPGETPTMISPTKFVQLEDNSELSFIDAFFEMDGAAGTYFNNIVNGVSVGKNAHAHHYRIQQDGKQAFTLSNTDIDQDKDSTFSSYTVDLGAKWVRNNLNAKHLDSGITTNYYAAYFGKEQQHIDNHTFIDHAVPHCQSNELYKGILTDKSRGVFNGKVLVRKDAQKTNAFQQNSSLVLSDKAAMDTKPQLEIFADDVRCSHGATIGQLDEQSVFYLRSRGLSDNEARTMLQQAFIAEAVEPMKNEAVLNFAEKLILEKF